MTVLVAVTAAGCGEVAPAEFDAGPIDAQEIDTPAGMATLTIDRNSADLGMVIVGQTSAQTTFTITNTGNLATGALTASASGAGFATTSNSCAGVPLAAGANCAIAVTATPTAPGPLSGNVTVTGTPGGSVSATLTATGLAAGALMAMPANFDFGVVPGGTMSPPTTITIRNTGGAATGVLSGAISGADSALFPLGMNGCAGMALPAGGSCTITLRMQPGVTDSGTKNATLTVMATPGGATTTMLTGTAQLPGVIVLAGQNGAFGDLLLGMSAIRTATVVNSGQQTTGPLMITRNGAASYSVLGGMAGDCASGTTTLAGGAMCNLRVQFTPTAAGPAMGSVVVSATPGGTQTLNLTGNGQRPANLTANTNAFAFGLVEVNAVSTTSVVWTITNGGDVASSVPMLMLSGEMDVAVNGCTAALPAGGMCSMTVRFKPSAGGARTGNATLSITGSSVMLNASATGGFRLTVNRLGNSGTISSNPAGITCAPPAPSCSAVFAPGNVMLLASTTNGSGVFFSGWSGAAAGPCNGRPSRNCTLTLDATATIGGVFSAMTSNLVFVSSGTFPTNLGGTAPYDGRCNQLATAAGINNAANSGYIAWMSDGNSNAIARLGLTASGWVRMDGRVFAADRNKLIGGQILNPVRFTESGSEVGDSFLLTGTTPNGTLSVTQDCENWSNNTSGGVGIGLAMGGPSTWTAGAGSSCAGNVVAILCVMKDLSFSPVPAQFPGKQVWLSNTAFVVGPAAPDAVCNADRPATATSGRALITRTTATAASLLAAAQMYVRPDGQEVGTGAEIIAGLARAGIWQSGNARYGTTYPAAWTGSAALNQPGTLISTCGDWTDSTSAAGVFGLADRSRWLVWSIPGATRACNTTVANGAPYLYCYEP